MATKRLRGDALAVAQVSRLTPANVEVGDVFSVTLNGRTISYPAAAATVADVTAGLTAAWNGSTYPEFAEVTASDQGTYVRLTADTPGRPFGSGAGGGLITTSATNGGAADTQTLTFATDTPNAGPNCWDTAENWLPSGVPGSGDDVYLDVAGVDLLYGLDQNSVILATLSISRRFSGQIGLATRNSSGEAEYRPTYLAIGATICRIGHGDGLGSGRIKIDFGSAVTTCTVEGSGTPAESGLEAVLLKGTHGSNALYCEGGSVAWAGLAGETGNLVTVRMNAAQGGLRTGPGVTYTAGATVVASAGFMRIESACITVEIHAGASLQIDGSGTVSELRIYRGGTCYYATAGTLTTLHCSGLVDFSRDLRARTVTNGNLYAGGSILDPQRTVTWTNGVDLERCGMADLGGLDLGRHIRLTIAAAA